MRLILQAAWRSCGISAFEAFQDPKKKGIDCLVDYALSSGMDWVTSQGLFRNVLLNASKDGNYGFIIFDPDVLGVGVNFLHSCFSSNKLRWKWCPLAVNIWRGTSFVS